MQPPLRSNCGLSASAGHVVHPQLWKGLVEFLFVVPGRTGSGQDEYNGLAAIDTRVAIHDHTTGGTMHIAGETLFNHS